MLEFYHAVQNMDPNCLHMAVTVIGGDFLGEKALASNRKFIWKSEKYDLAAGHKSDDSGMEAYAISRSGVYTVGSSTVFCEFLGREKKIVVCGGGHVSIPIIQIGRMIGCRVLVLEDRPKFADYAKHAGASEVLCGPFVQELEKIRGDLDTFFVIVTRGHRYDQVCLERIAKKKHAYIGMIGSRHKAAMVKQALLENGADREVINRVHTPIGFPIGARTPEEIAVSVMAEIIEVKNRQPQCSGYSGEILDAVLNEKNAGQPKTLATIVRRKGSAPREAGAKMLILPDGSSIGTIGGGCVESAIQKEALLLMRTGTRDARLCHADMTGNDAGEEGMACGGTMDVLLEVIGGKA